MLQIWKVVLYMIPWRHIKLLGHSLGIYYIILFTVSCYCIILHLLHHRRMMTKMVLEMPARIAVIMTVTASKDTSTTVKGLLMLTS